MRPTLHRWRDWLLATPDPLSRGGDDRGASLVEVTVAMAIGAVLLVTVIGVLDSASTAARSMESRAEINERRGVLEDRLGTMVRAAHELTSAAATEICTSGRSRRPIDDVSTVSATAFESTPRDTCVRVDGSAILSVATTSGSPSSELILTGATGSAFTFFDADAMPVEPAAGTEQISAADLARVRRVVFTTTVTDRLRRTTEDLELQFALGGTRFTAEQSWRGRAGATDHPATDEGDG